MTRGIFEPGVAYIGTAMIDKDRKKVFQVVARRGRTVSIVNVKGVVRELVDCCDGTEFCRIQDADGFDYLASASVPVDIDEAHNIVNMCK